MDDDERTVEDLELDDGAAAESVRGGARSGDDDDDDLDELEVQR